MSSFLTQMQIYDVIRLSIKFHQSYIKFSLQSTDAGVINSKLYYTLCALSRPS